MSSRTLYPFLVLSLLLVACAPKTDSTRTTPPSGDQTNLPSLEGSAAKSEDAPAPTPTPEAETAPVPTPSERTGLFPFAPELAFPEAPRLQDLGEAGREFTELRVSPDGFGNRYSSIQEAIGVARKGLNQGKSVRIVIEPGTYRETLDIADLKSEGLLVIEAAKPDTVIISGGDLFSQWRRRSGHSGQYEHAWPHKFGYEPNPWPGLMPMKTEGFRRELLFADARPQIQVYEEADLREGTYFVDEAKERVIFYPGKGVSIDRSEIEISVRPEVKNGAHSKLLRIFKSQNIILRNLRFQYGSTAAFAGAVQILGSSGIRVENCAMVWNSGVGLLVNDFHGEQASNIVIRDVQTDYNGFMGLTGGFEDGLLERHTANFNNWRGMQYGATGWAPCGWKLSHLKRVIIRYCEASGNGASGGWFDDEIEDVLVDGFIAVGNFRSGLSVEGTVGPSDLTENTTPGTLVIRRAQLAENTTGLNLFDSRNVALVDSIIVNNSQSQIRLSGSTRLSDEELATFKTDWRRRRLSKRQIPENLTISDTIIAITDAKLSDRFFKFGMREGAYVGEQGYRLQSMADSLSLNNVTFIHPDAKTAPLFPTLNDSATDFATFETFVGNLHGTEWNTDSAREQLQAVKTGIRYPSGFGEAEHAKPVSDEVDALEL